MEGDFHCAIGQGVLDMGGLGQFGQEGRQVAAHVFDAELATGVMGDMGEAGAAAGQFHDEIGGHAKSRGIDRLLCLGDLSVAATHNFGAGGQHFARIEDLLKALRGELDEHTTVLVKGSRFMKMERVADEIVEKA